MNKLERIFDYQERLLKTKEALIDERCKLSLLCATMHDKLTKYITHSKWSYNDYNNLLTSCSMYEYVDSIKTISNSKLNIDFIKYTMQLTEKRRQLKTCETNIKLYTQAIQCIDDIKTEIKKYGRCITGVDFYMNRVEAIMAKVKFI